MGQAEDPTTLIRLGVSPVPHIRPTPLPWAGGSDTIKLPISPWEKVDLIYINYQAAKIWAFQLLWPLYYSWWSTEISFETLAMTLKVHISKVCRWGVFQMGKSVFTAKQVQGHQLAWSRFNARIDPSSLIFIPISSLPDTLSLTSSHPCIIYTLDFNRLICLVHRGGGGAGTGRASSLAFCRENDQVQFHWFNSISTWNIFWRSIWNSCSDLLNLREWAEGWVSVVVSVYEGGGLVPQASQKEGQSSTSNA